MNEGLTKQAVQDMIYLTACALHNEAPEKERLSKIELNALYRIAKCHTMTAVVCMALESGNAFLEVEPAIAKQWQDDKNKSIRKTMLMDAEWQNIMGFMDSQGIWYMPLKGLVIKDLYPKYGMRQMADYDILFDPAAGKKIKKYMIGRGYEEKSHGKGIHDTYFMAPVYNFELHRELFGAGYHPAWCNYYKNVKERLISDKGCCYHFCDEDFYIYITAHAYKHFAGGGTGLRSLMDCYVFCQKKRNTLDWHYISTELDVLGLAEFEQMCRELAFCLFSEPNPDFMDEFTGKQKEALSYFIGSGTYGTMKHDVRNKLHALQQGENEVSTKTKLRYLWRRLIPGMAWFQTNAPFCYRHKWAIPFYLIYRVLRGLIFRSRKIRKELQTVRKTG